MNNGTYGPSVLIILANVILGVFIAGRLGDVATSLIWRLDSLKKRVDDLRDVIVGRFDGLERRITEKLDRLDRPSQGR